MSSDSMPKDPLTDHAYDGIQEYDNPLPGWWKWLFIITVIFAPPYYMYFHMGPEGRSIHDQYDRHMSDIFEVRFAEIGILEPDKETIMYYLDDSDEERKKENEKWRKVGETAYKTHCVSCHNADGTGNVGPNLTDNKWKHVTSVEHIAKVLNEGANNGAMPAWASRLHPNQIVLLSAYVAKLGDDPKPGVNIPDERVVESW